MGSWQPDREEAEFIGRVMAIDAGLAGHVTGLLRKGHPLRSVRATLEDAIRIARMVRPAPPAETGTTEVDG